MKVSASESKFLWVGNNSLIDFINTEIVQDNAAVDLLQDPHDLLQWLREAGIVTDQDLEAYLRGPSSRCLEAALREARDYRNQVRAAVETPGGPSLNRAACLETNRLLSTPRSAYVLRRTEKNCELLHGWFFESSTDLIRPLAFIFADLIVHQDPARIRKCQNPACVLFFLDTSRSATRRWCRIGACGNQQRAAAFRKRHGRR